MLFPRRPTAELIEHLTPAEMCTIYAPRTERGCVVLSPYRDPTVRATIQEIKFHNNEHAAALLAELFLSWTNTHIHEPTIVLPIPLSPARLRERGYNQVMRVVNKAAAKQPHLTIDGHVLKRRKNTRPQTQLAKEERQENLKDAFTVANIQTITGSHVLLVDDVLTTGATMSAARAALVPHHPASLTCLALAH